MTLAKELSNICRYKNKVEVADIVALLSKYDLLPNGGSSPRNQREPGVTAPIHHADSSGGSGNPAAVFLFQQVPSLIVQFLNLALIKSHQALGPTSNPSSSPHRSGLDSFLQTQVYRHRKRAHSPHDSHSFDFVSKRFKRL